MKFIPFLLIFCLTSLFASTEFPTIIDFREYKSFQEPLLYDEPNSWTWQLADSAYELGCVGFNDSPEIGTFIHMLKKSYQIPAVVETEAFLGATTLFFSMLFDEVHTIEISEPFYHKAKERLKSRSNIYCHCGDSERVLSELLPTLQNKRTLFYLDANRDAAGYWPMLKELDAIGKTHKDNCVIAIDHFLMPDDHGYMNTMDIAGRCELLHGLIRSKLKKIFTKYDFYYLIPKSASHFPKFIAIPKSWANPFYAGRIDVLPGQNFYDLPINLKCIRQAGYELRISHQFFNGRDRGNYAEEIRKDDDLKKILVLNNTVDPTYLSQFPKEKLVLFLLEPLQLSNSYYEPCSRVYTWNDDLVDGVKFFKLYYPNLLPMLTTLPSFEEKKLCVMVSGSDNSYPERPNELYSERMKIVEFFETKPAGEFDIYGRFWTKRYYRDFRGSIPGDLAGKEKIEILKNYRFAICFENTKGLNGYITEKIFSCFAAGCVPIYWGAENIERFIPEGCFIDYRDFATREQLYRFIKSISKSVYEGYIDRIQKFLHSKEAHLFSPEHFGQLLHEAIQN